MITVIYIVWLSNQFFILIIMLNFLISVISQTYESVMAQQEVYKYKLRSNLNYEHYKVKQFSIFDTEGSLGIDCLNISSDELVEDDGGHEWKGFVNSIKSVIKN